MIFEKFEPGEYVKQPWKFPLPSQFGNTVPFWEFLARCYINVAYGALESTRIFMMYKAEGHDAGGVEWEEESLEIDQNSDIDLPVQTSNQRTALLRFVIPNSELIGKESGYIWLHFHTSTLSQGPIFLLAEAHGKLKYGPQGAISSGLSLI